MAETTRAAILAIPGLVLTFAIRGSVAMLAGLILLFFAVMALGHATAVGLGTAPPGARGERSPRDRGSRR
jgi:hypothetical protein